MSAGDLARGLTADGDSLLTLFDRAPSAARSVPHSNEGWSAQDVLGHLSYWDQLMLTMIAETLKQGYPTPVSPASATDDLNGRAVAQRKRWAWERVRAEFENTRHALITRTGELTESQLEFYIPSPWLNETGKFLTLEDLISEGVLDHAREHRAELDEWLGPK